MFQTNLLRAGTHLLAISAGWGLWAMAGDRIAGKHGGEHRADLKFRSHERSSGSSGRSASDLLDRIASEGKSQISPKLKRVESYRQRLLDAEELKKRAEALPPAADRGAAAMELLEAHLAGFRNREENDPAKVAEMEFRLVHWMESDPQAALTWFSGKNGTELGEALAYLGKSLDVAIPEAGIVGAGSWIGNNSKIDDYLKRYIADHAGAAADLGQLARLKAGLDAQHWNNIRLSLIDTWPMAKADDLFQLSQDENAPLTVLLYAKHQGAGGMGWLQRHLASGDIDPSFRNSLLKHHDYHQLMFASPQYDFDKRVEVVRSFEPGKQEEQVRLQLGVFDVVNALNSGRDWRFAFRHGQATADEIYAEMAKSLPELAAKAPESLRLQLFKELSEFGGPQASTLLDTLPAERKWAMVMKAPQWQFHDGNPQDFHDFISTIPEHTGDAAVWDTRLRTWEAKTRRYRERFGAASYDAWVETLPSGIDREMAAYALSRQVASSDPEAAAKLVESIKNPELRARLESGQ